MPIDVTYSALPGAANNHGEAPIFPVHATITPASHSFSPSYAHSHSYPHAYAHARAHAHSPYLGGHSYSHPFQDISGGYVPALYTSGHRYHDPHFDTFPHYPHHGPYAHARPLGMQSFPGGYGGASWMPRTGPARAIDCLPGPNKCLPNGMRNPWAPYAGEGYMPASNAAENQQLHQQAMSGGGSILGGGSLGGSVIAPSRLGMAGAGGGGSLIAPRALSLAGSYVSAGALGARDDDGWNGARGRDHRGIEPDMMSTSGALGPVGGLAISAGMSVGGGSSWGGGAMSSPLNHVPLSQARYSSPQVQPAYVAEGVAQAGAQSFRPRRASMRPVSRGCDECSECSPRPRAESIGARGRTAALAGSADSPYRKVGGSPARGSPLRPEEERGSGSLSRKVSGRSHRSDGSGRHCSECDG